MYRHFVVASAQTLSHVFVSLSGGGGSLGAAGRRAGFLKAFKVFLSPRANPSTPEPVVPHPIVVNFSTLAALPSGRQMPTLAKPTLAANFSVSVFWLLYQKKNNKMKKQSMEEQTPERRGPEGWEAQNFAFFPPFPPPFRSFLCLSRCLLVEFWWCLKRQNPQMCTFGVLRLSCETQAPPKPPGLGGERTKMEAGEGKMGGLVASKPTTTTPTPTCSYDSEDVTKS